MISFLWTFFNNFAENTVFSSDEITLLEDSLYLCKREIQNQEAHYEHWDILLG